MHSTMTADTISLTATLGELDAWQHQGLHVYATPSPEGLAMQVYVSSRPNFRYDFRLAEVQDFLEEEGWDCLELDEEDPSPGDTITLTVPRARRDLLET